MNTTTSGTINQPANVRAFHTLELLVALLVPLLLVCCNTACCIVFIRCSKVCTLRSRFLIIVVCSALSALVTEWGALIGTLEAVSDVVGLYTTIPYSHVHIQCCMVTSTENAWTYYYVYVALAFLNL